MIGLHDQERNVFGCMPGCRHHADLECTEINDTVFRKWLMLEFQSCFRAGSDYRTSLMSDLAVSGDKVCMQVGIENMRQRKPALGGGMQVPVHVPQRVYQYPPFRIVRSD